VLRRALTYLYTKETKSSHAIEHIRPTSTRIERFAALLQLAEREDFCQEQRLVELQNRIVDPRFREDAYRTVQNYVGEAIGWRQERVHYVCPRPEDVPGLMAGLIAAHACMERGGIAPIVHAAVVAYGFVFIHPFEDGNGRIHRFLIHNVLARRGLTPPGLMFPVSATMLKHRASYDASLEAFSHPLRKLVEYELDDDGRMTVRGDTRRWYRAIDLTAQAEALFAFIEATIDTELAEELAFLAHYDRAREGLRDLGDLPDRAIDLFIRFCLQNEGRLSERKRERHFAFLGDEEIAKMERVVHSAYDLPAASGPPPQEPPQHPQASDG